MRKILLIVTLLAATIASAAPSWAYIVRGEAAARGGAPPAAGAPAPHAPSGANPGGHSGHHHQG